MKRTFRKTCTAGTALLIALLLGGCNIGTANSKQTEEQVAVNQSLDGEVSIAEHDLTQAADSVEADVETEAEVPTEIQTEAPTEAEEPLITVTELPTSYQNDVEALLQNPELPTGCEITSLTCLLNWLGFPVDKEVMVDTYLDYVVEDGMNYTFFEKYVGDPRQDGYGCYSPVIMKAATEFLADQNSALTAINLSGSSHEKILQVIASDHPVVIWNTMGCSSVTKYLAWTTPAGEEVYWCNLEHCMLLTGYDLDADTVTVCDPLNGVMVYNMTQFFSVYDDMYQQAMTIY